MTLGELLGHGGWPMVPIYLCSIATVTVFLYKLAELRASRLGDTAWLEKVLARLAAGDRAGAAAASSAARHPSARALDGLLALLESRPSRAEAEAARLGSLELQRLERHLGLLSFIAQVAPLFGLLGTVIGMVELFIDMQGGAPITSAVLSEGIWKALLTTAAGLIVAVPALAGHTYLTSRTDRLRLSIHDSIERALTAWDPGSDDAAG